MAETSFTGSESFAARLLRSERWRIWLMVFALGTTILSAIVRRFFGDVTMSRDNAFWLTMAALGGGLAYQGLAMAMVRRRMRLGGAIPMWQRIISVAVDLGAAGAFLLIVQFYSPRGAYAALSGPSLLLMPIVILLSILRLRPWFAAGTGFAAAAIHLALTIRAIDVAGIDRAAIPLVLTYSVLLAIMGIAAAGVALMMRRYVIEAVEEATHAERAQHSVALIEQDLRVARDIQIGLLPSQGPAIEGFDVAGMARPAAQAGGDYYDWQLLPDGRLVVAIADVTGHGIGPALVMAVCRAYARATAPTIAGPDALLTRLNELIYEDVKGARFITMVVAVVSTDGTIETVSAGHGPTLLYEAKRDEVTWFGGDGLPLGVIARESYGPRRQIHLESGDVLVMLTDGFMEYMRAGDDEQFGTDRLTATLKASAGESSARIVEKLDAAVTAFASGAPQMDDMTAVVIKRE